MKPTPDFYPQTLKTLLDRGIVQAGDQVLVVCGGGTDRDAFQTSGFTAVTISNLDVRMRDDGTGAAYEPYEWSFQDVEALDYPDDSFDLVVAHSGLHHCRSPHRGLLEMYRVARKAVIVFEPRDGLLTRLGVKIGIGQEYELDAVVGNGYNFGGVVNTAVPNFVFRWSHGDVEKTIKSYAPHARHRFGYFHALRIAWYRLEHMRNPLWLWTLKLLYPLLSRMADYVPGLTNNFAFLIYKPLLPEDFQPWIAQDAIRGISLRRDWRQKC